MDEELPSTTSNTQTLINSTAPPDTLVALFDEIAKTIRRFVVLDEDEVVAITLWLAHSHLTEVAGVSPLLLINSPEKGCAKTLTLDIVSRMVLNPLPAANITQAALFRSIAKYKPTLLIDEGDTFLKGNDELHGIINAGNKAGGYVLRCEAKGDTYDVVQYSVYGAKAIAGIALERHLPESTLSRGIAINLRKKLPGETVERLRNADARLFENLATRLKHFATSHKDVLANARPHLPEKLSDRAQDNWECLLAIAECAGPRWLERATKAALKLSGAANEAASAGNELLSDIYDAFEHKKVSRFRTAELLSVLTDDEELGWATYNRGRPLTARQLAKLLTPYGIRPKTIRFGQFDTPKGYEIEQFRDAFARYLSSPVEEAQKADGVGLTNPAVNSVDVASPPNVFGDPAMDELPDLPVASEPDDLTGEIVF